LKLAVVGATGFIGRALLTALSGTPHQVTAVTHASPSGNSFGGNIRFTAGDIHERESLHAAFHGAEAVFHLVGIIAETRKLTFEKTIVGGTRHLVDAACDAGVKKLIYLSGLGTSANPISKYFRAKWESEIIIRNSGLEYVILRPSFVFGPEDKSINRFAKMFRRLPFAPVIGDGRYQVQPLFVGDLVQMLISSLDNARAQNQVIEMGGPEIFEFREIVAIIKKSLNIRRVNIYIPFWFMKINAMILEGIMKPAPVTVDQLKMLQAGSAADNRLMQEIFNITLTPFEDKLKEYLR